MTREELREEVVKALEPNDYTSITGSNRYDRVFEALTKAYNAGVEDAAKKAFNWTPKAVVFYNGETRTNAERAIEIRQLKIGEGEKVDYGEI